MIEIKNVSVSFGDKNILKDFSLKLEDKGIVLLTGASGVGKTTITRLILGLLKADRGSVDTKGAKIATVFQEDRLLPHLSAIENVALVSNREEAEKILVELGLADSLGLLPSSLSGGMKRRVAIARALAFSGDVLLLDEAFNGIDEPLARKILADIVAEYSDRLIIAVTHQKELFDGYEYTEIKL